MADSNDGHNSPPNPVTPSSSTPEADAQPKPGSTRVIRDHKGTRQVIEVPSTGHSWDGIEEYDNPLPRWWLWTFYATVVWAVVYVILYPAIPLINGSTRGLLNTNTRIELAEDMRARSEALQPIQAKLVDTPLEEIAADPELANYTANAGAAIFRTWCAQCHGSGAGGAVGYPSLLDNDWLWGGTLEEVYTTVQHGIRDPKDGDTRYSEMPRFGLDGMLDRTQISQVVNHVLELGGKDHDAALAAEGKTVFADNCSSCHAEDGTGDRAQGAPNLTDAVWLYGSDPAALTRIVTNGPFGVMPSWTGRLTEADIRAVATYVHGLGGGE